MSDDDARNLVQQGKLWVGLPPSTGSSASARVGIGKRPWPLPCAARCWETDVDAAVGLGAGADAAILRRKRDVVSRAVARARAERGDALARPRGGPRGAGGPEIALLAGVTLGSRPAACRCCSTAGDLGRRAARVPARAGGPGRLVAGHRSRERAHAVVLVDLGLEPLLDLRLRAGEGVGACLAAQLLLSGCRSGVTRVGSVIGRRPRRVLVLGGARSGSRTSPSGCSAPREPPTTGLRPAPRIRSE